MRRIEVNETEYKLIIDLLLDVYSDDIYNDESRTTAAQILDRIGPTYVIEKSTVKSD